MTLTSYAMPSLVHSITYIRLTTAETCVGAYIRLLGLIQTIAQPKAYALIPYITQLLGPKGLEFVVRYEP